MMLPGERQDQPEIYDRYQQGNEINLKNRNVQSRRCTMVNSCDIFMTIEGGSGTKYGLDLAVAIKKPIFPVPFCEGKSAEM
jgi:hypothetical protein